MRNIIKFILLISCLIALVLLLNKHFPNVLSNDQNKASLISSVIIITLIFSRIAVSHMAVSTLIKQILVWVAVSLVIITGYSYKLEMKQFASRLMANIVPGYAQENNDGVIAFYAGQNGHFNITVLVNNTTDIDFMLDTGASVVSLTYKDAKKIGVDVDNLTFNIPSNTANGISWGAKIMLDSMQIGPIMVHNIPARVSQENALDISLLGMSFLRELKQFNIQENKLTMTN